MARRSFEVRRIPGFGAIAILTIVLLYVPILILVTFSFNAGRSQAEWEGFSLQWYRAAFANEQVQDVSIRSLWLAIAAAGIATVLATLAALGTTRVGRFRGQTLIYALVNQPLMVPEVVTGIALLIFVASIKVATGYMGMGYLVAAHTAFCIPFAYLPIRARLETLDLNLERAAADLYASPVQAFRHITLPLLVPGIAAGFMLGFVISLDTVVITEFVKSAGQDTLPTYMLGQLRRAVTPEMNAIASLFLALSLVVVTAFFLVSRRRGA
ncbi:ABC transporter permease [Wenxinia marina]|uniref:Spermidine/putrescine transport system permease protein PotC n=1 Tax=Wenxinia marina DSM 24838 TaxID=1123501 RepID=A0A0D0P9R8_9RHOB|nr:ABC transporter permease [Wenxinia marina]KIQ68251.1 ABC-type spermidine/putrescine transport system, permease component II [Wenxinia marina DSM 24838]GGL77108.1 ABC transporter permease [Wenxinia marina]